MAEEIVQLNEQALAVLHREGNVNKAVQLFSRALDVAKSTIRDAMEARPNDSLAQPIRTYFVTGYLHSNSPAITSDGDPYVVRRFLNFWESPCINSVGTPNYEILYYGLLFNLALTYHLKGMESKNEACLRKALTLYELTENISRTENLHLDKLQRLAILNNIGVLLIYFQDEAEALRYFQKVFSNIFGSDGTSSEHALLDHEDFQGCMANCLETLRVMLLITAAAA